MLQPLEEILDTTAVGEWRLLTEAATELPAIQEKSILF